MACGAHRGQSVRVQVVNERRAVVVAELRELVAGYETGRVRTSFPTVADARTAASYTGDEYAALVDAARPDKSHNGSARRLRWWVFLSLAAETDLGVVDLVALTWNDLISLPLSLAVRNEVLTPEHLTSLRTATWLEASSFVREIEYYPFPWSPSYVLRKLKRLCSTTGVAYRG